MERTLEKFLKIKGSNTPTEYQLSLFGIRERNTRKGWLKPFLPTCVKDEDTWTLLLNTLVQSDRGVDTYSQKVYVMSNELGHKKIGKAEDVDKRLRVLQTGSSTRICVESVYIVKYARGAERALHDHFREYHLRGEWFSDKLCTEDIDNIDKYVVGKGSRQVFSAVTGGIWDCP